MMFVPTKLRMPYAGVYQGGDFWVQLSHRSAAVCIFALVAQDPWHWKYLAHGQAKGTSLMAEVFRKLPARVHMELVVGGRWDRGKKLNPGMLGAATLVLPYTVPILACNVSVHTPILTEWRQQAPQLRGEAETTCMHLQSPGFPCCAQPCPLPPA